MNSPFVMVIFGATGDLAKAKLIPSLFSLFKKKQLPKQFSIIGFARRLLSPEEFNKSLTDAISSQQKINIKLWKQFLSHISYQEGFFEEKIGYEALIEKLNTFDQKLGACITRFFYLATPPDNYETIIQMLQKSKLSQGCGQGSSSWTRVIVEKPFGKDLETARLLDQKLAEIFEEKQIFRVDHYLGKETMQNMLAFRFANGIFEPVWNNKHIDHVQITWGEKKGIFGRGKFFDGVGMLRDVAQNHLMQFVAAIAMEQPKSFEKEAIRDARAKAIKAISYIEPDDVLESVVRGQYNGYKEEKDVAENSQTETFVAFKLFVNTDRFSDVPFYLRAGKNMPENVVEISIVFIHTCLILFKEYGCPEIGNVLKIRIQPDEGISLKVIAKTPGSKLSLGTVDMKFSYKEEFAKKSADAYEKVLLDIFAGDQMLFNRSDELESSWEFITKILRGWEQKKSVLVYDKETWGPKEANDLIEKDGRKWL